MNKRMTMFLMAAAFVVSAFSTLSAKEPFRVAVAGVTHDHLNGVVSQLRQGVEGILSHPNITLVREKGVFTDAHTVGDYTADKIIIATGSETKWLPIKGVDTDPRVVDSTGLLQLDTLPKRLAIIGAGVIGMEFASVFNRFGSTLRIWKDGARTL